LNGNVEKQGRRRSMSEDLIRQVEDAIACSRSWAEKGWPVTFGPRNVAVSSLKEAKSLPATFLYRQEALNYWNQARLMGNDAGDAGMKALDALKSGNMRAAHDALYLSQYIEKPLADNARTWHPVYEAFTSGAASS
jgi:hypothetical protein